MNGPRLIAYLESIDRHLNEPVILYVYGAAAFILLGEEERSSLDIDVAGPYSQANHVDFRQAVEKSGLSINPDEAASGDHIEWISPARLCLPKPEPTSEMILWRGGRLTVKTVSPADLAASKLIRYDEIDQSDVRFLWAQKKFKLTEVAAAVRNLPPPFNTDAVVLENLRKRI
jgi:hypothetical protein